MNYIFYRKKSAQRRADLANAGRENGPWHVVRNEDAKGWQFWRRRWEVEFVRPENY